MKNGKIRDCILITFAVFVAFAVAEPVFSKNRMKNLCLDNLKKLSLAVQLYVDDYDEKFPPPYTKNYFLSSESFDPDIYGKVYYPTIKSEKGKPLSRFDTVSFLGSEYTETWADALFPYIKDSDMYICPESNNSLMGYAYNWLLGEREKGQYTKPVFMGDIYFAAKQIVLTDSVQLGNKSYIDTNPGLLSHIARHNGGVNAVFADGHASYKDKKSHPEIFASENASVREKLGEGNKYWDPKAGWK